MTAMKRESYLLGILYGPLYVENNELKLVLGTVPQENHFQGADASTDINYRQF